jgi:alpha-2-macroglobulin
MVAAMALVAAACSGGGSDSDTTPTDPASPSTTGAGGSTNTPSGGSATGNGGSVTTASGQLGFRLSEGTSQAVPTEPVTVASGEPLTDAEIDAALARLPEWVVPAGDEVDFNRPVDTLGPPLVGDTIDAAFPPPIDAPAPDDVVADGPLEVVRFQPEGDVDIAPFLSVTFDEPMVPLGTLDQLDAADVPVQLTPAVDGRWRWIGTRTLRFEVLPDAETGIDRLPAATDYTVTIPAGTTSANGAVLADDVTFEFSTPVPQLVQGLGLSESMSLAPVMVAVFDQRVDPAAVLDVIEFESGNVTSVRLATDADLAALDDRTGFGPYDNGDTVRAILDQALPGRAFAFVPASPLSPDTAVRVTVGPGIPSLEGPRTNDDPVTESGRTFAPLQVTRAECGFGGGCEPFSPFGFEFNNAIDESLFDPTLIRVEPAVPGLRAQLSGSSFLLVEGITSGNTTYTVTISAELTDVFGQSLGEEYRAEFEVGDARPLLNGPNRQFVTTDPFAEVPALTYAVVNHDELRVTAWELSPDEIGGYQRYLDEFFRDTAPQEPSWPVVLDTTIETGAEQDVLTEVTVDLGDAFDSSDGLLVVRVQPDPQVSPRSDDYWQNQPLVTLVQSSTLGIDAFVGEREVVVWTTDLQTGEPVADATVELLGRDDTVTTDADGLARVELTTQGLVGLRATDGQRSAVLPSSWFEGWTLQTRGDEGRWYVIDDRGIYRPGETARIAGYVRELTAQDAQLALFEGDLTVNYQAYDPQGNELATGTVPVNALGGFNLSVDIPEESNTGFAFVEIQLAGAETATNPAPFVATSHGFQIQDFRTPDFEVTARTESAGPYYVGEPATVAAEAEYFAGGPLPDAEVNWLVSTSQTSYTPPNRDDFNFGIWTPWWFDGGFAGDVFFDECFDCFGTQPSFREFSGRTDGAGVHYLQIDFETTQPAQGDSQDDGQEPVDQPTSVTAEATVFDVNRQAFASRTNLLVHPAEFYVGVRSGRSFVRQGEPIEIDAIVTDVDGELVADRTVAITAGRVEWSYQGGRYTEELVDTQTCEITSTTDDDGVRCEFASEVGGEHRITAIVADDAGRTNRAQYTQWVSGATSVPNRTVQLEAVTIVPDAETYEPGDTAELLLQAPFSPATALVTVTRAGIESSTVVDAPDGSAVVEIAIADDDVPNLDVRVDMVGSTVRLADDGTVLTDAPRRPAFAAGVIGLSVPPVRRTLDVAVTPAATETEPGSSTSVEVAVTDASGAPVADAGVVLVVVDEAVLALSGYELADPLDVFYGRVGTQFWPELLRQSIVLSNPELIGSDGAGGSDDSAEDSVESPAAEEPADEMAAESADAPDFAAADDDSAGRASAAPGATIDVRTDFDALAVFAADETTGADGTTSVAFDLPDNLTRYRVMAVAVDGVDRFGTGESTITARLPISVRPLAPRFLNFGDRFELPVVVQNLTDAALDIDVAIESANLELTDGSGRRVTVPANDRVEVRFPAAAAEAGTARFRVVTVSGELADAAEVALPVYTPATAEAFATYGVVDGDAAIAQPILAPEGVFGQFGGLEISTSSTALQALTDAVLYLYDYRYDSADGLSARIMAVAALRDVLDAFDAAGLPDAAALDRQVGADIDALVRLQNGDGGFPYWQRGRESVPWVSVTAAHALVLARDNGYTVDQNALANALQHLADIENYIPAEYGESARDAIRAYAIYVRDLAGQPDPAKALDLYRSSDVLELDSIARLWPVIDDLGARDEIERLMTNSAVETAGAATFATSYGEDAYLIAHSDRRTDGIVLGALVSEVPDSDLVPKVVAGLLGNQIRGRWNNAYENSSILLALNDYFDTFESVDPDFVARAWLGDTYAAEAEFRGRSTDTSMSTVPMAEVIAAGDTDLILDKDGAGRLYYRLGLRYAPDDLDLDPRDEGFVVERTYRGVDDPTDVERLADGTWQIRAGASVEVTLTMVADARRTHVALIDPLPAGFEAVNPALASAVTVPTGSDAADEVARGGWWWWQWYEHQNLRDDRAEAFTSYLPGGTYEYTYVARATTPGEFVVPPTRAEEIYAPEVFGRGASDRVTIIDE